jgi:hypothetical protein
MLKGGIMFHRVLSTRRAAPRRLAAIVVLVLAIMALGAVVAGSALAAPTEPTLTIDQLRSKIDLAPGHTVPGYFLTVLHDDTITRIPCTILAVTDSALWDNSSLIMFEATGADIAKIGGIAAGMSGSPVFVDEGGDPSLNELVGAVSYGNYFTTNGLGLATPVEYMSSIEDTYMSVSSVGAEPPKAPVTSVQLDTPVKTRAAGTIDQIVLAPTMKQAAKVSAVDGSTVMASLMELEIGGLSPNSAAYKHLAAKLEARGFNVFAGGGGGAHSGFTTTLKGGASVGAAIAYGDYWIAAMGTVTYVNGSDLVAFGHPLEGLGQTSVIMTNCYVDGVWSSLERPYKIMSLGQMRGTFTQDRSHGIAGTIGATPPLVDITASATLQPSGPTKTAQTSLCRDYPDLIWWAGDVAWGTAYLPVDQLVDGYVADASTDTQITMVLNDGTDHSVSRTNMTDGVGSAGDDAYSMLDTLLSNPDGTASAKLVSIDASAEVLLARRQATVLDIDVPGGLHVGDNTVIATVRQYGQLTTETRTATLTIPAGTVTHGELDVYGGGFLWNDWWYGPGGFSTGVAARTAPVSAAVSVAPPIMLTDLIADVESWPQNNDLVIDFYPDMTSPDMAAAGTDYLEVHPATAQVLYGEVYKQTSRMYLRAFPSSVPKGGRTVLRGIIEAGGTAGTVSIYKKVTGFDPANPGTPLVTVPVVKSHGMLFFVWRTRPILRETRFVAIWSGNDRFLSGSATRVIRIAR